jgi:hypothetical protein
MVGLLRSPILVLCHHHFCAFGMLLRKHMGKDDAALPELGTKYDIVFRDRYSTT